MDAPPPPPMAPPSLRATKHVPDEIVEDIFVRVPPDDGALLLRSAFTCKRWARLFADRGYRRRYSQRHGTAPLLGIIANLTLTGGVCAQFIPTRGFRPARDERHGYRAHDARHGRVLLNRLPAASDAPQDQGQEPPAVAVWNPITGEQHQLPLLRRRRQVRSWNAAVLCGADADAGACDHVDCHRGPFRVVFVGIDAKAEHIFSHVYSSDSGAWSKKATTAPLQDDQLDAALPGVLAWNALHFVLLKGTKILKCDATTGEMFVIRLPAERPAYGPRIVLTTTEDGGLGFVEACRLTGLLWVWSVELGPVGNAGRWVVSRFFNLVTKLPVDALSHRGAPLVVAFADGVIFIKSNGQLYTHDLKSGQVGKILITSGFYDIVPYISFYTPVLRAALPTSREGTSTGASTSA